MALEDIEQINNQNTLRFAFDSLESIRKRLLDLTGRNSLLNFKHPKTSCIRIIDEAPNQIYYELLDGKKKKYRFSILMRRVMISRPTIELNEIIRIFIKFQLSE